MVSKSRSNSFSDIVLSSNLLIGLNTSNVGIGPDAGNVGLSDIEATTEVASKLELDYITHIPPIS